jgi:hypothetical protein
MTLSPAQAFFRRSVWFVLIGLGVYAGVYAASELVVRRHAQRNRFYAIRATAPSTYDYVILGASHAAVFGYRDMNTRLENLTGSRIMNLAVVGGGIALNALLFDYFLTRHRTGAVLYVVDSFAFRSPEWNEERLQDTRLFARAPFDPALVALLLRNRATRLAALDHASGFSKINNRDRFASDVPPEEGPRFERTYRPVRQIDEARVAYLYARTVDPSVLQRYMGEFESLVRNARAGGMRVIAVKPPIPDRIYRMIPDEARFDATLETLLDRHGAEFHDFSRVGNDEHWFSDTDHLNRSGVLHFFETSLRPLLVPIP